MDIFNLPIKRYICPYCGKWHELNGKHKLGDYTHINPLILHCPYTHNNVIYILYKQEDRLHVGFFPCMKDKNNFIRRYTKSKLYFPENDADTLTLVFCVLFNKHIYLPINDCNMCRACQYTSFCNPIQIAEKLNKRHILISLGFEFETSKN